MTFPDFHSSNRKLSGLALRSPGPTIPGKLCSNCKGDGTRVQLTIRNKSPASVTYESGGHGLIPGHGIAQIAGSALSVGSCS